MADIFKPNLAGTPDDISNIKFPVYASPKLDGIRAVVHDKVMSRSMKPIPNEWVQAVLARPELRSLDGELIVGSPTDPNCMQNTSSGVMSQGKVFDFQFHVFDDFEHPGGFSERLLSITEAVAEIQSNWHTIATSLRLDGLPYLTCPVVLVPQVLVNDADGLLMFESQCLSMGFEGAMVRSIDGKYKQGRSTSREGGLLKIKRFVDGEFLITGFEEEMKNNNPKTMNEVGRSKRSSHKDGKEGKGVLGAFVGRHIIGVNQGGPVRDPSGFILGAIFNIGTGMDAAFRKWAWENQDKLLNKVGIYKSFPVGVKDAPRHPVFKCLREKWDMS